MNGVNMLLNPNNKRTIFESGNATLSV